MKWRQRKKGNVRRISKDQIQFTNKLSPQQSKGLKLVSKKGRSPKPKKGPALLQIPRTAKTSRVVKNVPKTT